jgi:hypothetical protein
MIFLGILSFLDSFYINSIENIFVELRKNEKIKLI